MNINQIVNSFFAVDLMLDCNHKWFIFGGNYRRAYRSRENSAKSPINFIIR